MVNCGSAKIIVYKTAQNSSVQFAQAFPQTQFNAKYVAIFYAKAVNQTGFKKRNNAPIVEKMRILNNYLYINKLFIVILILNALCVMKQKMN